MSLIAYHNDKAVKKKYLDRVRAHRKADKVVQGYGYWQDGKGCAVGCTIEGSDHKRYETELGIPEWLARVEDTLFEGMSKKEARLWPEKFLKAIRPGADLSKAEAPFVIFILKGLHKNYDTKKYPDIKKSIDTCIALYKKGDLAPSAAWSAAESAAWSAAESAARSAAWSAAESAAFDRYADKLLQILKAL